MSICQIYTDMLIILFEGHRELKSFKTFITVINSIYHTFFTQENHLISLGKY